MVSTIGHVQPLPFMFRVNRHIAMVAILIRKMVSMACTTVAIYVIYVSSDLAHSYGCHFNQKKIMSMACTTVAIYVSCELAHSYGYHFNQGKNR